MSDTTLDDFRDSWACEHVRAEITTDERREEFDRMIAKVRAEALRDARADLDEWADELALVVGKESDEESWVEIPLGEWLDARANRIEQGGEP